MHLIKLPAVKAKTGKSRSSIYEDPTFPDPVETGPRSVAWVEEEVDAWIAARIAKRDERVTDKSLKTKAATEAHKAKVAARRQAAEASDQR